MIILFDFCFTIGTHFIHWSIQTDLFLMQEYHYIARHSLQGWLRLKSVINHHNNYSTADGSSSREPGGDCESNERLKPIQKDGTHSDEKTAKVDWRNRRVCKYCKEDFSVSHVWADYLNPDSDLRWSQFHMKIWLVLIRGSREGSGHLLH